MSIEQLSLYALWAAVILNLALTVRLLGWARLTTRADALADVWSPELELGSPAPTFRARLVDGRRVNETSWAGLHVAYLFLSPNCDGCRHSFPKAQEFFRAAEQTGTRIVVVTDTGPKQTEQWLDEFRAEGTEIRTPVIAAPTKESKLVQTYDGPGFFPYYVFVGSDGAVIARGIIGRDGWLELIERWAGRTETPVTTVIDLPDLAPETAHEAVLAHDGH